LNASVDPQRQAQAAIDELVASGVETGIQVAVLHEGRVVVDAVAGLADPRTAEPVAASNLFFAASTGKGVATSVAHVLVERGGLSCGHRSRPGICATGTASAPSSPTRPHGGSRAQRPATTL